MFFDMGYLLWVFIPSLILSGLAQLFVSSAYNKWGNTRNTLGLTGLDVARQIMSRTNVNGVQIEGIQGKLTDHYDPRDNTIRISQSNATVPSVAGMAVVAHELGHAQQHQEGSLLIQARNFLVPAVQFSPTIGYLMIIMGLMLNLTGLFQLGILLFGVMVVFMILTLPVEIDASRRGMILLRESGVMASEQDASGARQMLTAAALTYFAAAIGAVLQLLYFMSLGNRRR
ncbi:MAG: zinc metallopeptidase [Anaerolineae bacterium]|nr:zinc metallopeptidase [Anaerolineae bacterium]